MDSSTPQYIQPAPDPALATLQAQTDRQRQDATQTDLEALNARHAMMYGTRVALGGSGGWFTPNQSPNSVGQVGPGGYPASWAATSAGNVGPGGYPVPGR